MRELRSFERQGGRGQEDEMKGGEGPHEHQSQPPWSRGPAAEKRGTMLPCLRVCVCVISDKAACSPFLLSLLMPLLSLCPVLGGLSSRWKREQIRAGKREQEGKTAERKVIRTGNNDSFDRLRAAVCIYIDLGEELCVRCVYIRFILCFVSRNLLLWVRI